MNDHFGQITREAYYRIGNLSPLRRLMRPFQGQACILMYHRILPHDEITDDPTTVRNSVSTFRFEEQISFLAMNYCVVTLNELRIQEKKPDLMPVVVTFDDGYKDNLVHALPILKKYNVPATIYVATSMTEGNGVVWWHESWRILQKLNRLEVEWKGKTLIWELRTFRQKRQCWFDLRCYFLELQREEQNELLSRMRNGKPPVDLSNLWLSWEDLKALSREPLITIGSHGHNHENLMCLSETDAREDIVKSKKLLEDHINKPVAHFCYPYGNVSEREIRLVRETGFVTAVTTKTRPVAVGDEMHLPRHAMLNDLTYRKLDTKLSGWSFFWHKKLRSRTKVDPIHLEDSRPAKPRVLYMLPVSFRGGAEKVTIEMASHMHGYDPVFMLPEGDLSRELSRNHEVIVNDKWISAGTRTGKIRVLFSFLKLLMNTLFIYRSARHKRIDMIHACRMPSAIRSILAARLLQIPLIWTNHDVLQRTSKEYLFAFIAGLLSSATVFVSKASSVNCISMAKSSVIHNGALPVHISEEVVNSIRTRIGYSPQNIYLGIIGRVIACKGHLQFLKLFRGLLSKHPNLRLLIIGMNPATEDAAYAREIGNYIKEYGLDNEVLIIEFNDQVPAYCRVLDFVVSYSQVEEAFAGTMLEAMAYGSIPIGSTNGGLPEYLKDGYNGFFINPFSEDISLRTMTDILDRYTKDRSTFAEIRRQGLETFKTSFSTETMCSKYRDLYDSLLSRRFSSTA